MMFLEFHLLGCEKPIQVNPNAIISYEPDDDHCKMLIYGNNYVQRTAQTFHVVESYSKVNDIIQTFEFVNEQHWMAAQVGAAQYIDFMEHEKSNVLRDEYLKWKGRKELVSKKRYIDADELLDHVRSEGLDTGEKIADLVYRMVKENNTEDTDERH